MDSSRVEEFQSEREKKVESFEDLHVYQRARELTNVIYGLTHNADFARDFGLVDQIRRASVSIMSNIAEGFERGTNAEFIQFLFIAKGSCGEVRAQSTISYDQKYISHADYINLVDRCRRISGMLSNLIGHLKRSPYRGAKYKKLPYKSMADEINELLKEINKDSKKNP